MAKRKSSTADWQDLNQRILAGLDLQAEFAALGIDITAGDPKSDGWMEAHAVGRDMDLRDRINGVDQMLAAEAA